jgi:hypothetical protein
MCLSSSAIAEDQASNGFIITIGNLVTDDITAVTLAETLISRKYGEETLIKNRPLKAREEGEFWVVEGKDQKPGVLKTTVRINKADARIDEFLVVSYTDDLGASRIIIPEKFVNGFTPPAAQEEK